MPTKLEEGAGRNSYGPPFTPQTCKNSAQKGHNKFSKKEAITKSFPIQYTSMCIYGD